MRSRRPETTKVTRQRTTARTESSPAEGSRVQGPRPGAPRASSVTTPWARTAAPPTRAACADRDPRCAPASTCRCAAATARPTPIVAWRTRRAPRWPPRAPAPTTRGDREDPRTAVASRSWPTRIGRTSSSKLPRVRRPAPPRPTLRRRAHRRDARAGRWLIRAHVDFARRSASRRGCAEGVAIRPVG